MWKEFRSFIATGNVIEFAVGVIMAGAVGAVVNGFVSDVAMPLVGFVTGGIDFSDMKFVLSPAVLDANGDEKIPEVAVLYGKWITSVISLVTVGFIMFMIIKAYNKMKQPAPVPPAKGPSDNELLTEIRDLLKK